MKILAYSSPSKGQLYPLLPTLLDLPRHGHQIAVRTLASEVELLGRLGFAAAPIRPRVEIREMDAWRGNNQLAQLQRPFESEATHANFAEADTREGLPQKETVR